jgi:MYXO-CTERM domain-containing protein
MERRIQPWMRGVLCACCFLTCAQTIEQKSEEEIEAAFCSLVEECFETDCNEAEYIDRSNCTYDARAAEDCLEGLGQVGCDNFLDSLPSACDQVYTDCDTCEDDPFYEDMDEVSEGVFGDDGTLCSKVDSDVYDGSITAGNPNWGPWEGGDDHTEFYAVYAFEATLSQDDIDRIDRHYPCGAGVNAVMGCDSFGNELTPGPYVVIGHVLKGTVPLQDTTYTCQYGFVFDRDGEPSNNLVAQAPFIGDFFQGTDFWTVLQYTPFVGWFLDVVELRGGIPQPIDELARVIIDGNSMTALVPKSSLPAAEPCYRVTVHCHQGDFGETLPTTADTERPIEEELRCVTAEVGGTGGQDGAGGTGGSGADEGSGATGGDETDGSDDGGCGCSVSPESFESSAVLALFVLLLLSSQRIRRKRA